MDAESFGGDPKRRWAAAAALLIASNLCLPICARAAEPAVEDPSAPSATVAAQPAATEWAAAGDAATVLGSPAPAPNQAPSTLAASCSICKKFDWSKVPPVHPFTRTGMFLIPPTGPGYYSLLDALNGDYRDKPPLFPLWPTTFIPFSFFDADFRYLEKPDNTQHDFLDPLKRIHIGDDWLLSFGGELRSRYMIENQARATARNDHYELLRGRLYADLWYRDEFRIYAEGTYSDNIDPQLAPRITDVDRGDLQNFFVEFKLFECLDKPVYLRAGRQELRYGSQRLVSPLDWVNTRRTFQGVTAYRQSEKWDSDLWWVQPIIPNANRFDAPDSRQNFFGWYNTFKVKPGTGVDLYILNLDNHNPVATGQNGVVGGYNTTTLGTRIWGDKNHWLYDFEGDYQFGSSSNQDTSAGAFSAGLGRQFACAPMNPIFWVTYDFASGSSHPGTGGVQSTFNQLFPFGHYYFGYIDLVGRSNIHDVNCQFSLNPTNWITTLVQYHNFNLDSPYDALYGANGAVVRRDPTGRSGVQVGNELDYLINFHIDAHEDFCFGYSKLYSGNFIRKSGPAVNPELIYFQYSFKW